MLILIIGDSHCQTLHETFKQVSPDDRVITVSVGSNIAAIISHYNERLATIRHLRPDCVVLHVGHNDMSFHPLKNTLPRISRDVTRDILAFASSVRSDIPNARILLSSILPRKPSHINQMSAEKTDKYNKLAVRHGLRLRKLGSQVGFEVLMNTVMWKRVYKYEPKNELLLVDGLHLTDEGMKTLVQDWINFIKAP
jgi:lysophospholipase L1-like esterase